MPELKTDLDRAKDAMKHLAKSIEAIDAISGDSLNEYYKLHACRAYGRTAATLVDLHRHVKRTGTGLTSEQRPPA